jgi:hypothetical protein
MLDDPYRPNVHKPVAVPPIQSGLTSNNATAPGASLACCFVLGLALAARRSAPPLYFFHPRRGAAAALASSARQAFKCDDGFLDLCALLAQVSEHLQHVHAGSIAQLPPLD